MKKLLAGSAVLALIALPAGVHAQSFTIGPTVGFHGEADFGIGGYISIPLDDESERLAINGSFGMFFPSGASIGTTEVDIDYWEANADLVYSLPIDASVAPFAMAGLNIARVSGGVSSDLIEQDLSASNTEVGINLGGGIVFPNDTVRPFVGAKYEIGGGEDFMVFGGIGIPIGN